MCNILRHIQTHRKKLQGAVTARGDTILTDRGLTYDRGHCTFYRALAVREVFIHYT